MEQRSKEDAVTFPVNSTSVETAATKRALRVMQRTHAARWIAYASVFACRHIADSTSWSDHAFGAAADLFPKAPSSDDDLNRRAIFHALIYQATHRTTANRGRRIALRYAIDHDARLIWTPEAGIHAYTGTTGNHVHGSFGPKPVGTPPCAT
jgi:hypothetical protein